MKLMLLTVGPTDDPALRAQIETYAGRLSRYIPFEMEGVPDVRSRGGLDPGVLKAREADQLLRRLQPQDMVWILDEKGKEFDSRGFAGHLQKCMNAGPRRLVLIIGGAYGFDPAIRQRAQEAISLSKMTFNHQVIRLMAVEQLYRAFSILRGDPYHND